MPRPADCITFSSRSDIAALRKRGLKARRLENGSLEWRAAGLPFQR
ncbi:MAG: hypothetical protein JSU71_14145 [Betaproteobacteria bacterium]|nr:MAG: hypothetical protein JSU71_14145 [Betaproteobacteria bacterium]